MPNARGATDATVLRSKEQEWKRSRGAIACAECRRLKLKCDKSVPCTSCRRRGCASICPNGSLVTGQGTRFVLADTDRLHNKITDMSDRIRQLEDALSLSHFNVSQEQHPLLQGDLLKVKSIIDLHAAVDQVGGEEQPAEGDESQSLDIFGTLALRDDGASTFYGRSAGQESILLGEGEASKVPTPLDDSAHPSTSTEPTGLPYAIIEVARAFPDASVRLPLDALEAYLPHWDRASELCALYLDQAPWFFGAVRARQLHEELLPLFYPEAPPPPQTQLPQATPHDLALIFVIFCFGAHTDEALPPAPGNAEADMYYLLTKAAFALDPVMDHAPTVSTVQALSLMGIYQGLVANEHSIESTWALMGLAAKLAQSLGLHRDCARWKLPPSEVQKRRALFWELFITDCWQSLATGRIATFSLPFTDCELPQDTDQTLAADGTPQASFPFWKAKFGKECVADVVAGILTARPPKYSIIIALDRKIRDMEFPRYAIDIPPEGAPFGIVMQHYMPINYRHMTLLYIHRTFFAQALCDHPYDPLHSQYAPSILSGYRSACQLLTNLREGFAVFPARIARFWVLWTHAFSAAVMLALIPVRAPLSKLAYAALTELKTASDLFEQAAPYGGRAVKMLPVVRRHLEKATRSVQEARSQALHRMPDVFPKATRDEFSVFSGVTSTVSAPAVQRVQVGRSAAGEAHPGLPSSEMLPHGEMHSGVPGAADVTMAPWGEAHATLVDQLVTFEGSLDAQISSAEWQLEGQGLDLRYPSQSPPSASSSGHSPASQPSVYLHPQQQHSSSQIHLQQQQQEQHSSHIRSQPPQHSSHVHLQHQHSSHSPPVQQPPSHQYAPQHQPQESLYVHAQHQQLYDQSQAYVPSAPQHHYYPPPQQYHAPPLTHPAYNPPSHSGFQHHPSPSAHSTPPLYTDGSSNSPASTMSMETPAPTTLEPQVQDFADQKLWSVPHTEVEALVRPRSPPPRARDRVLRQSGDLSLTEAWSAFMSQMDMSAPVPPRTS